MRCPFGKVERQIPDEMVGRLAGIDIASATDMRRDHHVRKAPERAVGRQGFDGEDVQSRTRDCPVREGRDEGVLVDDASAPEIDEKGGRFIASKTSRLTI
jgi:hypothetical protein